MADYIDREKIFSIWRSMPDPASVTSLAAAISQTPAADVVEVRRGRWIPEACASVSKRNRLIEYRVYSCSICGRSNGRVKKRYCPNCGALMDKEGENGD